MGKIRFFVHSITRSEGGDMDMKRKKAGKEHK
jgi:hypothetical protein